MLLTCRLAPLYEQQRFIKKQKGHSSSTKTIHTMYKISISLLAISLLTFACPMDPIYIYGKRYQSEQDYESLAKVVEQLELGSDTSKVRQILGEPIDMGFDFRYLLDSVGPNGCVIGAVFHINEKGKIDQKWLDEICE